MKNFGILVERFIRRIVRSDGILAVVSSQIQ
jgi:hypothetical protein